MTETVRCPFCLEEIDENTETCPHCGEELMKTCPYCGEKIKANAIKCKHCGEFLNKKEKKEEFEKLKELPEELHRFNWGAFMFVWIWGICNKSFQTFWWFPLYIVCGIFGFMAKNELSITLVGLVWTIISLALPIWFGIRGNEWAWKNKKWRSIEHFNRVQRNWGIAAGIFVIINIILLIIIIVIFCVFLGTLATIYG